MPRPHPDLAAPSVAGGPHDTAAATLAARATAGPSAGANCELDELAVAAREAAARRESYDAETADSLRLWVVLSRAYAAVQAHAAADVARHGLSLAEFGTLEMLYHRGPRLVGDVQRGTLMSSGGMTCLLDRLEGRGLVVRRACPADRRAVWVALTADGVALMDTIFPAHAERVRSAVAGVAPAERRGLRDGLKRLGRHAADAARALGLDPAAAGAGTARAARRGPRRPAAQSTPAGD